MAVQWVREAVELHERGELVAPPRGRMPLGDSAFVITAGDVPGQWYGYRTYDLFGHPGSQHVVVAHAHGTGAVLGVAIGVELGIRCTGALGGVAVDALAQRNVRRLAIIGTGRQAFTQAWAAGSVRAFETVRVHSPTEAHRTHFATRLRDELALPAVAVGTVREAVDHADVVILTTRSTTPVIDTAWLQPDVAVVTVGPKQAGRAEVDADLLTGANQIVTDSLAQLESYAPPALAIQLGLRDRVASLGSVIGAATEPPEGRRVYLSVGLAGTDVHLLARLAEHLSQ